MTRGFKYTKENTPYKTKFFEDGKVYAFPSLKQLECFSVDVNNIIALYNMGVKLYGGNDEPIEDMKEAIDNNYNLKYKEWLEYGK